MRNLDNPAGSIQMPTLFVPHGGGPCFFMEWDPVDTWDRMADFLRGVAATLPQRPRSIVLVSGHWLESEVMVTSSPAPDLIYDYYGFPAHTYELSYPAPGEPELAARLVRLLGQAGIAAKEDPQRGFDHGVFIPMKLMFPDAEIPVVQLSLRKDLDARAHLDIGRAISSLRDDGVLIIGSGMSFHNMRGYGDPRFGPVSDAFDTWLTATIESQPDYRDVALVKWDQAPMARLCHPLRQEEHLLPLLVAAGAGDQSKGQQIYTERVTETTLSAFRFG